MDALAEIIRDERLLSQLERMASGGLDAAEQAALEERAKSDPSLQRALELCRPRADEFHQRLAQAAQTAMAPARLRRPHWARRYALVMSGVAAAAIAAVVLLAPEPHAELPSYRATVTGAMEYRTSAGEVPSLAAGGPLEIVLRPATKVSGSIDAWFFVLHGEQIEPLSLSIEIDPSGSVRAVGTVGDWGEEATLRMAVGARAPSREEAAARASGWRWTEQKIRIHR